MLLALLSLIFFLFGISTMFYMERVRVVYALFVKYLLKRGIIDSYPAAVAFIKRWGWRIISGQILYRVKYKFAKIDLIFAGGFTVVFGGILCYSIWEAWSAGRLVDYYDQIFYEWVKHLYHGGLKASFYQLFPSSWGWTQPNEILTAAQMCEPPQVEKPLPSTNVTTVDQNQDFQNKPVSKTVLVVNTNANPWGLPSKEWLWIIFISAGVCVVDIITKC